MNEQRGITVVAAIGIIVAVILAIVLIQKSKEQTSQTLPTGQIQEPISPE